MVVVVVHRGIGRSDEDRGATERASGVRIKPKINTIEMKYVFTQRHLHQLFLQFEFSQTYATSAPNFIVIPNESNFQHTKEIILLSTRK